MRSCTYRRNALALTLVGVGFGCAPGFHVKAREPVGGVTSEAVAEASPAGETSPNTATSTNTAAAPWPEELPRGQDDEDPSSFGATPVALNRSSAPAMQYAQLDRPRCEAELDRRRIAFQRVAEETRGVIAPLRLSGPISGVDFHSMLPASQRKTSPYEIYDCRLVLALDDWARVLARYDINEVVHYSVYRPPAAKAVANGPGRRHSGALAIDAAMFKTRDGRTLNVEKDFHGRIGGKPCGSSFNGLPQQAVTLRQIVCEAADAQLFNVLLTPDFNWPHRNHFHLEVSAGSRWVYLR